MGGLFLRKSHKFIEFCGRNVKVNEIFIKTKGETELYYLHCDAKILFITFSIFLKFVTNKGEILRDSEGKVLVTS